MTTTLRNGTVWQAPNGVVAVLQWVEGDRWGLLSAPARGFHGGTCSMFISEPDGRIFYRAAELPARMANWVPRDELLLCVTDAMRP